MARNTTGTLFKRGTTWWLQYIVNGRRVQQSLRTIHKKEAIQERDRILAPLASQDEATRRRAVVHALADAEQVTRQALEAKRPKLTLAGAWEAFIAKPRAMAVTAKQRELNASRWADFVAYMAASYPGACAMVEVTPAHAEGYLAHLRSKGRFVREHSYQRGRERVTAPITSRALSPGSLNMIHATCRMVFETLAQDAGLSTNPFASIARMKAQPIQRDAFSLEEVKELVNRADAFLQPLIITGASTGLRLGDCCTLRWEEMDFSAGGGAGMILRRARKTGAAVRIPLLPGFRKYLEERRPSASSTGPCFPEQAEMYQRNPTGLSERVKHLIKSLDGSRPATEKVPGRDRAVSRRDFHSLRHSFLTLAASAGVPPHLLQQLAGHATPSMTARYTAHENDLLLSAKLAAMPDPLSPTAIPAFGAAPALSARAPALAIEVTPPGLEQAGTASAAQSPAQASENEQRLAAVRARLLAGGKPKDQVADLLRILGLEEEVQAAARKEKVVRASLRGIEL